MSRWISAYTTYFRHDYKKLRKLNPQIEEKVDNAITMILQSDNPRKLGEHKVNNMDCLYGYEIGLKYRILYDVEDKGEVVFHRVGLHDIYKTKFRRDLKV